MLRRMSHGGTLAQVHPEHQQARHQGCRGGLMLLLGVALCVRVAAMQFTVLIPEEAYYWLYAQHPALGYYDHPPMVAWCIKAGTMLFGDTELGVRAAMGPLMLASSVLMYQIGRWWAGRRAGLAAALMLQVLPLYFALGYVATMDAALVFFWLVCLMGVTLALKRGRAWGWYLAGAGLGGAALSKYTALFLGVGVVLSLLLHRPWRRHLRSPHVYLAALVSVVTFSPVLFWNATHDWASFRFQFVDRFEDNEWSLGAPVWFLGIQAITVTPPLVFAGAMLATRVVRRVRQQRALPRLWTERRVFAWAFALPLLAVMAGKSLSHTIHVNWTLPAYLSLMPLLARALLAMMRRERQSGRHPAWSNMVRRGTAICLAVNIGLLGYVLIQPRLGRLPAFGPWRELAAVVNDMEGRVESQTRREPLIVGDGRYRIASVLAFYRAPLGPSGEAVEHTTSQWVMGGGQGLGFEYWMGKAEANDRDCIIVTRSDRFQQRMGDRFAKLELVKDPRLEQCLPYRVFVGYGLRR